MRKVILVFVSLLMVLPFAFAGGQGETGDGQMADVDYTDNPYTDGADLSGMTVNILGAFVDEDANRFNASMVPFEQATGIDVVYEGSGDFETLITVRAEGGSPPDVAAFPQPGLAADLVQGGYVYDMGEWLGMDYLGEKYNQTWLDLADLGGIQAGVWYRASVKSLVWYNMGVFQDEGYEIPETWAEMLALSDQMVADGYTPWSIGIESSGATGWVATDWIEDVMLRIHPPEVYDRWVTNDLKFNSPEFKEALAYMAQIWFNEDYVLGGREGIVLTPFGDAITPLIIDPPAAILHRQASFIPSFMPDGGDEIGEVVDFFYLPPIDEEQGSPVLGAGDMLSPMRDTPEVRAVMRFLSTGDSIKEWVQSGGVVAPHKDAKLEWYPTEANRKYAEILHNADTFRFDGSDMMPGQVGAGAFWKQMTNWVSGDELENALKSIDQAWPEEE